MEIRETISIEIMKIIRRADVPVFFSEIDSMRELPGLIIGLKNLLPRYFKFPITFSIPEENFFIIWKIPYVLLFHSSNSISCFEYLE